MSEEYRPEDNSGSAPSENEQQTISFRLIQGKPIVTYFLIGITACVYLMQALSKWRYGVDYPMAFGAKVSPYITYYHQYWRLITPIFLHGSITHILFNMYALVTFGSILENNIGSRKFLVFYFVSGFGAVLLHLGVEYLQALSWSKAAAAGSVTAVSSYRAMLSTPTVGASGAIYGLLIAFAMLYPDAVLTLIFPPIPMKAKWWILIFAFLELGLGVFGSTDGIAHFAHLGGMVFGALLMIYWRRKGRLFQRDKWI